MAGIAHRWGCTLSQAAREPLGLCLRVAAMEDYAAVRAAVLAEGVKDSDIPNGPLKELALGFIEEQMRRDQEKDG